MRIRAGDIGRDASGEPVLREHPRTAVLVPVQSYECRATLNGTPQDCFLADDEAGELVNYVFDPDLPGHLLLDDAGEPVEKRHAGTVEIIWEPL